MPRSNRTATSLKLSALVAALLSVAAAPAAAEPLSSGLEAGSPVALAVAADVEETEGHDEMEMTDTEMAEEGHDLDGADHAEDDEIVEPHGPTGDPEDASSTHDETGIAAPARPRAVVLTTFLIVNAGVLGAAALLRRRDRDKPRHSPRPGTGPAPAAHPA